MPLAAFSARCTWQVSAQALVEAGPWLQGRPAALNAFAFWAVLAFATMLPPLMMVGLGLPRRCPWHCASQGLLLALVLRRVPAVCAAPLLQHPASQRQVGAAHAALRLVGRAFGMPAAALADVPFMVQCRSVFSTLLFMLGFVHSVVFTAVWEYEAYMQFVAARERQARGGSPGNGGSARRQQRGRLEAGCRAGVLSVMLGMLGATVWDVSVKWWQSS